jgi:hypothetical protein
MSLSRKGLVFALVLTGAAALRGQTPAPRIPDTGAGRIFQQWLNAYNAGDSLALIEYARQYEPELNVALNLAGRAVSGGVDVQSIEESDARHLAVMLKTRRTALAVYAVVDVSATQPARASTAQAIVGETFDRQMFSLDAAERALAIDSLAATINRNYVFPEVGKRIADSLHARQARGAYDHATNQVGFARQLTKELFEIAHDKHMVVNSFVGSASRRPSPAPSPSPSPTPTPTMTRPPCGYEGSVLEGNVGYVTFSNFRDPEECGANASAAMNAIAGTRAVIIDLRKNGGGRPEMVAYLASYLFAGRTHLNDSWTRATGTTEAWWTRDDVTGPKFGATKPVYVLTSTLTISAAEEFAYDLQSLKRATIVGETTAGAAHLTASGRIGAHLMVAVPIARPINPITKTDWEGVGVIPDVRVPADDALASALKLIRARE